MVPKKSVSRVCSELSVLLGLLCLVPNEPNAAPSQTQAEQLLNDPAPMLEWLNRHHNSKQNKVFTHTSTAWVQNAQFLFSRFDYESPKQDDKWTSGSVFVIWKAGSKTPLWTHTWETDSVYTPHTVKWIDFDGDGLQDLWVMSGEGEFHLTELFMWPQRTSESRITLKKAYVNRKNYPTLLDVNNDGRPEILHDGIHTSANQHGGCQNTGLSPQWRQESFESARQEYRALAGHFAKENPDYGMPGTYEISALLLSKPVRLLSINNQGQTVEVSLPPKHIQWRITTLNEMKKVNSPKDLPNCVPLINSLITHNQKLLKAAQQVQKRQHNSTPGL